ncbi:MAG: hypothetical protein IPH75_14570 [bacterium]|nr:hypothetical protein [bacterium]
MMNRQDNLAIYRFILLLAVVVVGASLAMAGAKICAKCKKPIDSGKWFEIDGRTYHYNHFVCENCGKPIGEENYFARDGNYYDSLCFVKRFARRCAYCDQPMMEWVTVAGRDYHDACFTEHVADRCAICGKPILGNYLYDSYGAKVHSEHKTEAKQCDYCSRFLTAESEGGEQYPDGRTVCGLCKKSVVSSQHEADSLLLVAKALLRMQGIVIKQGDFDLELVSREGMSALSDRPGPEKAGFTHIQQSKYLGGLFKDTEVKIYILDRMPRIHFIATAAHELMHVWFGLNDRFHTEDILAEGSCNYASYLVLLNYPKEVDHVIDRMMEDDDPIYGEGFRRVNRYVEEVGIAAWLNYIREFDHPPWQK